LVATYQVDVDPHYLTVFKTKRGMGGFDLPSCRTRFLRHGLAWPFGDVADADVLQIVDRFDTNDLMLAREQYGHDGSYFAHVAAFALQNLLDGDESATELDAKTIEERLEEAEAKGDDVDGEKPEEESR
jgi:hypothetical protein